jgi:hypothetical protein
VKGVTYGREFCVGQLRITDVVDLRVKERHYFFGTHRVHLEFQVRHHVEILAPRRQLRHRRDQWRLQQAEHVQGQVLKGLRELALRLLHTSLKYYSRLVATQALQRKLELCLHGAKVPLVDLRARDCTAGPVERQCACVEIVKGQGGDVGEGNGRVVHPDSPFAFSG